MATVLSRSVTGSLMLAAMLAASGAVWAQPVPPAPDWYHVGNAVVDLGLAGFATGPVDRVWYSADGTILFAKSASGKTFETNDFEGWKESQAIAPPALDLSPAGTRLPESGARLKGFNGQRSTMYAFGAFVYQSVNGGSSWDNLTGYRARSIIGGAPRDLAISPRDPEELTVGTAAGVFRSLDAGKSWSGLNEGLPNLPAMRLWALPSGDRGAQIEMPGNMAVEWQPGEKRAWREVDNQDLRTDALLRLASGASALQIGDNVSYVGMADGRITSPVPFAVANSGKVERFWVDPADSRIALAVLGARPENALPGVRAQHVVHTVNGGLYWDDLTSNLPDVAAHGVAVSRSSGTIYVATDAGIYYLRSDVGLRTAPGQWQLLSGLPQAPVSDVRLDPGDNQLWAAVQGFGVYSTLAPHRLGDPKVVSTADLVAHAVAPGSLMSILGAKVSSALAGTQAAPVLGTTETESQIQIPFEVTGNTLSLSYAPASGNRVTASLALAAASPGILVDPTGTPMVLDATTGTILDASNPAHSRARIQIVATGLGRVNPDWPTGKPAPEVNPPNVVATVTAYLNRNPVQVTRAVLAPGQAGFYLVDIELPKLVNYGPAELYIEAGGHTSNPVRVYIEP